MTLTSAEFLLGYRVEGLDGKVGELHDLLFDDRRWGLRYLVITPRGSWLRGSPVLVSPEVAHHPDSEQRRIKVELSRSQIDQSPTLDKDRPVSLQHLTPIHAYYGWPLWWDETPSYEPGPPHPPKPEPAEDVHLRSVREVVGYHLAASDGTFGRVDDLIIDDVEWQIPYLVAEATGWPAAKRSLIAPRWISGISWVGREVEVGFTTDQIRSSPPFDGLPILGDHEERLNQHYSRFARPSR